MLLIAIGMARYSFQQGFYEFVGGMEEARLQKIGRDLVIEYQNNNNDWQWLEEQGLESILRPNPRRGMPRPGHQRASNPRQPPPPRPRPAGPRHENPPSPIPKGPSTAVFDQTGVFLAGNNKPKLHENVFIFEMFSDGLKIGEVRSWPNIEGSSELGTLFARQQFWSSIAIAVFCLLLAGGVSWFLSRKLLIPIVQLRQSISALNAGKYGGKLESKRTDELGDLMANLDSLSETLDKNRSAKNRMFADISHELRTPLTVLAGEIDLLKAGLRPFDQDNLLSLEQESNRLRHLVDDLYELSLSDVGGLKYTFGEEDLANCLVKCVESIQPTAIDRGLKVTTNIADDIRIAIDEKRIEQLLSNLLMNAISYTDSPGEVLVELHQDENNIRISIEDSAPGVDDSEYAKIFDPLFRVDEARSRRESGAGLGLAICKNIVEAHRGTIQASPSSLGGLCMTVTLPTSRHLA